MRDIALRTYLKVPLRRLFWFVAAVIHCCGRIDAEADYELRRLGLVDPEHTSSDGFQWTFVSRLGPGYVAGVSKRYLGTSNALGESVWAKSIEDGQTIRLGFADPTHTGSYGQQNSEIMAIADNGYVGGHSTRYSIDDSLGRSAWIASAGSGAITRIGLFGPEFTGVNRDEFSEIKFSDGEYLAGMSRLSSNLGTGEAAWIASTATGRTTRIGFFDAEHTEKYGAQVSRVSALSKNGYAGGNSWRYKGESYQKGESAWVYSIARDESLRFGFTGPEFTDPSGGEYSTLTALSESGYAGGVSGRYNGLYYLGSVAWISPVTGWMPTRVGLTDPAHTRSDGSHDNTLTHLTAGHAAGSVGRFTPDGVFVGTSAWIASCATGATSQIGLLDPRDMSTETRRSNTVVALSATHALGRRDVSDGSDRGVSTWLFSIEDGTTVQLGLNDARHVSAFGAKESYPDKLTESGFVTGLSWRFNDEGYAGQTAWIYDVSTGTTHAFDLSERRDHHAFSYIKDISETGFAVGEYDRYNQSGGNVGRRAFAWTPSKGFFDIGDAIKGGWSRLNTEYLETALWTNEAGDVAGNGVFAGARAAYLAHPIVDPFLIVVGDRAPGAGIPGSNVPEGATIGFLRTPAIADTGDFVARVGIAAEASFEAVLFQTAGSRQSLPAMAGGSAPGVSSGIFKSFGEPVIAPNGQFAFAAKLRGVPRSESEGVWTTAFDGTLQLALQEGKPVPGLSPETWMKSVLSISLRDGHLLALIRVAGAGVNASNDTVLIGQTLTTVASPLLRTGQPLSVAGEVSVVQTMTVLTPARFSTGHGRYHADFRSVARVTLANHRTVILRVENDGTLISLLSTGQSAASIASDAVWNTLRLPVIGSGGLNYAVSGTLAAAHITKLDNSVLVYSATGDAFVTVAREGQVATDETGIQPTDGPIWRSFFDPVVNDQAGSIAFLATLQGRGVKESTKTALWFGRTGEGIKRVVRLGERAPNADGLPGEAVFSEFLSVALPGGLNSAPIFLANVTGAGATVTNNLGLWSVDGATGQIRKLLGTGNIIGTATISRMSLLQPASGVHGATRSFNSTGSIIVLVTLSDRRRALLKMDVR